MATRGPPPEGGGGQGHRGQGEENKATWPQESSGDQ